MRMSKWAPVFLVLALGACGLSSNSNGPLVPDAKSPISDVPVPAGFSMKEDSTSQIIQANSLRVVNHRYTGSDDWLEVVAFYRTQLPTKEWTFVDQTQPPAKELTLHYSKRSEDLRVTVTKRTFDTQIRIKIDPIAK
jgi:hypothetical protein